MNTLVGLLAIPIAVVVIALLSNDRPRRGNRFNVKKRKDRRPYPNRTWKHAHRGRRKGK